MQWATMEGKAVRIYVDGELAGEAANESAWSWSHPSREISWEVGWSHDQDTWQQDVVDVSRIEVYDGRVKGYADLSTLMPHYVPASDARCDPRNARRASSGFYKVRNRASGRYVGDFQGALRTYAEAASGARAAAAAGGRSDETVFELLEGPDGTFGIFDQTHARWWYADDFSDHALTTTADPEKAVDPFARFHALPDPRGRSGLWRLQVPPGGSGRTTPEGAHGLFTTSELEDDRAWELERQPDFEWWHLVLKMGADDTFRYSSPLWTNAELLNAHDDTKPNRKLPAFNTVKFDTIRGCVGAPRSNCVDFRFANVWSSARDLFRSGYLKKPGMERAGFDRVFAEEPKGCAMQSPGFNVVGNKGPRGSSKVPGYLNNVPSQDCAWAATATTRTSGSASRARRWRRSGRGGRGALRRGRGVLGLL